MDLDLKNLWLNLTIVLPGVATYGIWRIVIQLIGYQGIEFNSIDDSLLLTTSVLFAVALLQQAFGISIEAALTGFFALTRRTWPNANQLFVGRFAALAKEKYSQPVIRTIGQFFLSLNLLVGECLVFLFFAVVDNPEGLPPVSRPPSLYTLLLIMIGVTAIVTIFRAWNATVAVREAERASAA